MTYNVFGGTLNRTLSLLLVKDWKCHTTIVILWTVVSVTQCVNTWSSDIHFGAQRLVGCNPFMVKLCSQLPEKYVQLCFMELKGECNLDVVTWQSDCLFYISDNKFRHIDIAFCALLKNRVIFKTFYLLKMDWILFIAIAYSMVSVSLAGFVSADKRRRYSHLRKCEFYGQTSSFDLDCHFYAVYVTLLHITVHFKPYIFQGCILL